jgi:hypothetical protein
MRDVHSPIIPLADDKFYVASKDILRGNMFEEGSGDLGCPP